MGLQSACIQTSTTRPHEFPVECSISTKVCNDDFRAEEDRNGIAVTFKKNEMNVRFCSQKGTGASASLTASKAWEMQMNDEPESRSRMLSSGSLVFPIFKKKKAGKNGRCRCKRRCCHRIGVFVSMLYQLRTSPMHQWHVYSMFLTSGERAASFLELCGVGKFLHRHCLSGFDLLAPVSSLLASGEFSCRLA